MRLRCTQPERPISNYPSHTAEKHNRALPDSALPERALPERALPEIAEQAERFNRVRESHKYEAIEDYVELIDDLISISGEARLVDVANRMGITQPTASKTLARLQRDGYITSEPYRSIFLTEKGKQLAEESRAKHEIVYEFLLAIGVTPDIAERDSEGMEHHVSDETLKIFRAFTDEQNKQQSGS